MQMKKLISLLLVAVMVVALAACGSSNNNGGNNGTQGAETQATQATQGGGEGGNGGSEGGAADSSVLKVALTNSFTGCSAINNANPYRFATLSQVYETLISCTEEGDYQPDLAKSWEQTAEDEWTIELFEGITDSEGNPFTTEDIEWAFNAHKEAGSALANYYDADAITVEDDTHFTLKMNTDSVGAFYRIAAEMFLCTKEAFDASGDEMATQPIGTGPYAVESFVEGSSCVLVKRDDYWQTGDIAASMVANYDRIEISYVKEATQMSGAITSGNVAFAGQVDMSISTEVDGKDGVDTLYISNGTYNGVGFNMTGRLVSDNLALREAVAYAIDAQGLIDGVYKGHGSLMTTYSMPTALDYDASWTSKYSYDPDKAKEKLKEAGYENGVDLTLVCNNVGEDSQIAELVQGYLSMVGINLTLDYVEPATQKARIAEGNWDIALVGGMAVADSYLFWSNLYNKKDNGKSTYFNGDPELYKIYDEFAAPGGKTKENLQALYEYEDANCTWFPCFNKQVLYCTSSDYGTFKVQPNYMSLPYIGTLEP